MLTKSQFLSALQCHKRLWLKRNSAAEPAPETEPERRRKEEGIRVGEIAREKRGEGVLIDESDRETAVLCTMEAIDAGEDRIFEAAVLAAGLFSRIDILEREKDGSFHIIEVKSSTKVKEEHYADVSFEKYALENAGFFVSKCSLMHLNPQSVYPNLSELFTVEDISTKVDELLSFIPEEISSIEEALAGDSEPEIHVSRHCKKPYDCPYMDYCWKEMPKQSIFTISRLNQKKEQALIEKGIIRLSEVPDDFPLSSAQREYVDMVNREEPETDRASIREKLKELTYPIYFFDIETDGPAIPRFPGMHPYEKFPFQFSCHILRDTGELEHEEFLHTDISDPRKPFIEALFETIGETGSIVVYHKSFEKGEIEKLAKAFPEHEKQLLSITSRLFDQEEIFKKSYRHPECLGRTSIKVVLPALVPELSYENLPVQEGDQASAVWNKMLEMEHGPEREKTAQDLKDYCKLDTHAMVEIQKRLLEI